MYFRKILIAVAVIGLIFAAFFANFVYNAMFRANTVFNNEEAYIFVSSNDTYAEVRSQLEPLLDDLASFDALAERKKYVSNIKPGKFAIQKGMSNNDIINSIRSNNLPVKVSFNNQSRVETLAARVSTQIEADSMSLMAAMLDGPFLEANGFTKRSALGMYIPNSYELFWNTSAEDFRDRMLKEYDRFWNTSRREKASGLDLSRNEVITLAAIVQKETVKVEERPRVAGVYVNRLKRGIPLQADPTIIYAIREKSNDFDQEIKRVLYKDLEIDSPYNTYKYAGLPPGPIAMPDISSIDAVLNYERHDYLYFVVDTDNFGYHVFAKSLAQHNRNKRKYVNWINSQGINR